MELMKTLKNTATLLPCLTLLGCPSAPSKPKEPVVRLERRLYGDIPVLLCYCDDGARKPLVILLHGFSGAGGMRLNPVCPRPPASRR
jgi:hypothetical protein